MLDRQIYRIVGIERVKKTKEIDNQYSTSAIR